MCLQGQERSAAAIRGMRQLRTTPPIGSSNAACTLPPPQQPAGPVRSADSASSSPSRRKRRGQQGASLGGSSARSGSTLLHSPHDSQASLSVPTEAAAQLPAGQVRSLLLWAVQSILLAAHTR